MDDFRCYLVLLLVGFSSLCRAQEEVFITKDLFNSNGELFLDEYDEWQYRPGNDPTWSAKELDTRDWKKFKYTQLSVNNADQDGRVEGWFRLKFKIDSSLKNTPLYIYKRSFDAADVFVDGKKVVSYGRMAPTRELYKASVDNGLVPIPISLHPNVSHTIAIHFVDYITFFPHQLISEYSRSKPYIGFAEKTYFDQRSQYWQQDPIYKAIWLSVGGLLCVLFWLLALTNPWEKSLRYIAVCSTLSVLAAAGMAVMDLSGIDFLIWRIGLTVFLLSIFANLIFIPLVVSQIFLDRVSTSLKYAGLGILLVGAFFIISFFAIVPLLLSAVFSLVCCLYFLVKYWKTLYGAQWAIVVGVLLMASSIAILLVVAYLGINGIVPVSVLTLNAITTGLFLSLPFSMLVYVSLRFKEIINEVQISAEKVVQIAEEKRELVASQNELLETQVHERTTELKNSLDNLKATQAQLIQSEKMASLGELTAGIAHEIQNPLNFVNNYSEVNVELIEEIKEEIEKGNLPEIKAIVTDLEENENKIQHHGKRADSIVRGMLLHSRTSSGTKEPTNLNALADEYLRLAYHGLRAKDQSFQADFSTDFDENLPLVPVIPQDIGRVFLNIINNAFQATAARCCSQIQPDYSPKVKITTKNRQNYVEICILDNGGGIPADIKDKIFQPFFTTKPTGQGTGLGLSLSYDIVKAHKGDLRVNSTVGDYTEFCIELPIYPNQA